MESEKKAKKKKVGGITSHFNRADNYHSNSSGSASFAYSCLSTSDIPLNGETGAMQVGNALTVVVGGWIIQMGITIKTV